MSDMRNIITKHNNKLLSQSLEQQTQMCNCRDKVSCPMDRNYLQKCFMYQAEVNSANSRKYCLGTSEDEFKTRYIAIITCHFEIEVMKRKLKILPCNGMLLQKSPPVVLYILMHQGQHFF